MKDRRITLVSFLMFVILGCTTTLSTVESQDMRCQEWTRYNPDSRCDGAASRAHLGSDTLIVDITEYELARLMIYDYDVIIVRWENISIETDRGEEVDIESSRLLPGAYIVYNTIYQDRDEDLKDPEDKAVFSLNNPQGSSEDRAYILFEYVRPARPTPTPEPTPRE